MKEFISFAHTLADISEAIIRPYFCNPSLKVEWKADQTPVTRADQESEKAMSEMIRKTYPNHGIIGEEFGSSNTRADYVWVLDPIDGTKSFTAHNAQFGTLIALLHKGEPILGIINLPATQQRLIGTNEETRLNDVPVHVPEISDIEEAILLTTDLDNPDHYQSAKGWDALSQKCKKLYTWGDCYGYYLLATGGAHIMCDPILSEWDKYALIPIIKGAGGIISDWQGKDSIKGNSIVAAPSSIHAEVIRILNR